MSRQRLGVIFGGQSTEHEVSVTSARSVMREADAERFEVIPFGITKGGAWLTSEQTRARLTRVEADESRAIGDDSGEGVLAYPDVLSELATVDVVFPIVHGTFGEDGTLQGLLELAAIPYVGSGVTASAVGMDKEMMRAAFAHAGLPQARYSVLRDNEASSPSDETVLALESDLGYPCFVKPANGGSSVGVSKARSREDLHAAVAEAARHDRKVMVEEEIDGREVECAVLGNADPQPSPLGEIRTSSDFYTYESKYLDDTAELIVPAELADQQIAELHDYAIRAFRAVDCAGLARVDFMVADDGPRIIEVNTIPGFTPVSMYPRLWQHAGLSYGDLITRLVELGEDRHREVTSHV
ncbi:MAG TPA: D-alanine--D-alanine ligase family protein [Dehalococcoidia bacterium]|nr:D-alanine--D-alanine ligase family protein [Dehalococcoidia bacterium]